MRYVTATDASDVMPLIREALEDGKKTQRMMAAHLGFSPQRVNNIITGKSGASLPVLFEMLEYVGIHMVLAPLP